MKPTHPKPAHVVGRRADVTRRQRISQRKILHGPPSATGLCDCAVRRRAFRVRECSDRRVARCAEAVTMCPALSEEHPNFHPRAIIIPSQPRGRRRGDGGGAAKAHKPPPGGGLPRRAAAAAGPRAFRTCSARDWAGSTRASPCPTCSSRTRRTSRRARPRSSR